MGRPLGSKNKTSAAPAAEQPQGSYSEGTGRIVIPDSNSSARLFPEQISAPEPQQPDVNPVPPPQQPVPVQPEQEPEQQPEPEATPAPEAQPEKPVVSEGESIYLEDLLQKMNIDPSKVKTRTKVDGVEGEASILDVKKNYQLEQHLTKRGQKIGEERRQLEAIRNELLRQPQAKPVTGDEELETDPRYAAMRQELDQLKSILPAIKPVIYQTERQKLADELKDQGFPDFMEYIGKIDARVAAEPDDNKWRYYNTPEGAKQLFFQMKLEEQRNGTQSKPVSPVTPVQPRIEPVNQIKKPPVIKIDGGGQPSNGNVDDYNVRMGELMKEWKLTKNKAILQEILKMKGSLQLQ